MAETFHRRFFIEGPAGALEALLWTAPEPNPPRVAVVCHPHPLFGGTMHNKVVYQAAKTIQRRGIPVLRFNFRGAGLSQGAHDKGRGEMDDVRAALDYLAGQFPGRPVLLGGFSFGAWVGLRVGAEGSRVTELIGLGLPLNDSDCSFLLSCIKPTLLVQGANDEFGSRARLESLFAAMPGPKRLAVIEGADHFFQGKLDRVSAAIQSWLNEEVL